MRGNPWEKTRQTTHSNCNFLSCSSAERFQTAFRLHTSCLLALPVFPWSLTPPQHPPPILLSEALMFSAWLLGDGSCENLPIGLAEGRDKQKGSWELFEACWEERERAKEMAEIEEAVEQWLSCSLEGWQRVFGQGRRDLGCEEQASKRRKERKWSIALPSVTGSTNWQNSIVATFSIQGRDEFVLSPLTLLLDGLQREWLRHAPIKESSNYD